MMSVLLRTLGHLIWSARWNSEDEQCMSLSNNNNRCALQPYSNGAIRLFDYNPQPIQHRS